MARKKQSKNAPVSSTEGRAAFTWILGIALVALGIILALGAGGGGGAAGGAGFATLFDVLGVASYLIPPALIFAGGSVILRKNVVSLLSFLGGILILLSLLAILGITTARAGGLLGKSIGGSLSTMFGFWGAVVIAFATALVAGVIVFGIDRFFDVLVRIFLALLRALGRGIKYLWSHLPKKAEASDSEDEEALPAEKPVLAAREPEQEDEAPILPAVRPSQDPVVKMFGAGEVPPVQARAIPTIDSEYNAPPLSLLGDDTGKPETGDIKANANIIKRCLQNFGIPVEMDEVSVGPTVTRYAMKPAEGVRLSKILSLQNNLELALAAHPVRIEAPIPGKSLVGIEVPNSSKAMVGLKGTLTSNEWNESKKPLLAALGRDISGVARYLNIAKAPHALVAGATGSGKSVAIHAIITSLLYRNGPNQLRFIMVDPKRVELTMYNGIPHLLTPVITDPKKTIMALKWATKEMERRYNILEAEQVRDIESYHTTIVGPARERGTKNGEELPESMPYIVIVVDELADIMQSFPRELESSIVRLAQMSRAVGIHLVLSTQRPSVNVITGLIKANVPTRLALQVASQIDSRTILDGAGAETLLGAGDMLYLSADMQKPVRIQTAYISENEAKRIVKHIKDNNSGDGSQLDLGGAGGASANGTDPNVAIMLADGDDDVDDDMYQQAKAAVEEAGRGSTSYLQRKLRIGYSRAARLMDILEEKGVIGPADGSRPRDVLTGAKAGSTPDTEDESV